MPARRFWEMEDAKVELGTITASTTDIAKILLTEHVCILTTEWGKPFTVDGFSGWMRDAMTEAGLPLDCRPHGVRKTFGRLLADAGASAHDIMAALGSVEIHLEWMTAVAR